MIPATTECNTYAQKTPGASLMKKPFNALPAPFLKNHASKEQRANGYKKLMMSIISSGIETSSLPQLNAIRKNDGYNKPLHIS